MKIYFAGSIRARRADQELYHQLIQGLQLYGQVLTEHVGESTLSQAGDDGSSDLVIFERDMGWLAEADPMLADGGIFTHYAGRHMCVTRCRLYPTASNPGSVDTWHHSARGSPPRNSRNNNAPG